LYALVKDIYRLAEASAGMKRMDISSRKGLSPLLAIIIGLVITVVAGILLAQLYFSYAGTISTRPAANVEYIDLVTDGSTSVLAVSIKNMGNAKITDFTVYDSGGTAVCSYTSEIPPGGVGGCSGTLATAVSPGTVWTGYVTINFDIDGDGTVDSVQDYALSVRARSA